MLERFDTVKGRTVCPTRKGSYIECENGNMAFLNKYSLKSGTEVLCTVTAITTDGFAFLTLDSILYADDYVA